MRLTSRAYGRSVGLELPPAMVPAVRRRLPFWWVDEATEPERVWRMTTDPDAETVISDLELWVAEHARDFVFVHAGVVAFEGRALLLPGRSHAGKTTATVALLRAGASYGSDEFAVIDPDGNVHPYPRPLSVRSGITRERVPAPEFGASAFVGPLPVGGVAVLRYTPDVPADVEPITPGIAVLRLFDCTICAQRRPADALDALVAATASARAIEGGRGEIEELIPALRALVS